jgi:hypothetical protein
MPLRQQKIDVRQIVKAIGTTNIIPIHWMTLPLTSLMRSMSLALVKLESLWPSCFTDSATTWGLSLELITRSDKIIRLQNDGDELFDNVCKPLNSYTENYQIW